jgi:hypothetical protein
VNGWSRFACIVGAPRCGTTALSRYLGQHPEVRFSAPKEPHFFSTAHLDDLGHVELESFVEEEYLERFFPSRSNGHLLAEGSVSYLYAAERMQRILQLWPDAKFIISVRDPMEMLPSLHRRMIYNGDETVEDFDRAWDLVPERRNGRRIPRSCVDPRFLDYEEIGRLGKHVERFLDAVGRERCFVSVYDEFAADPAGQYRRILDFLGLPDDGRTDFEPHRATQGVKSAWLQRLLKRPPKSARTLLAGSHFRRRVVKLNGKTKLPPAVQEFILSGRKRLLKWNKIPAPPIILSEKMRRTIRDTYSDDVDRLSRAIGRDLGHWLNRSGPQSQ